MLSDSFHSLEQLVRGFSMCWTNRRLQYKSYTGMEFSIRTPNGSEPQSLTVKVFTGKKPRAEVLVGNGWFSESRGYGGMSTKNMGITDPTIVQLCIEAIKSNDALPPLIDRLQEDTSHPLVARIARWWLLSRQENISTFLMEERKANKPFGIGDAVLMNGISVVIARERFCPMSQMWHFAPEGGCEKSQYHFKALAIV